MGFQNLTPRFQDLEPIKRPLTASFSSNIRKTFKMGIKLKEGETPTSWSFSKTHKSGTHAKPSTRRAVLLLVPKTANGWIACISREKHDSLTRKTNLNLLHPLLPFLTLLASFLMGETTLYTILSLCDLKSKSKMPIMSLHLPVLTFGTISAVDFHHFSSHTTYGT